MKATFSIGRRSFLKTAAVGAAVGVTSGGLVKNVLASDAGAWHDGMQINPNIDNLRVVCCNDPLMLNREPTAWTIQAQNAPVNSTRVHSNMDEMAKKLAQKPTAAEAWGTIFQKPAAKAWSIVRVAIKTNTLCEENMPRAAIIGKICIELNRLGVPYANMVMYDKGGTSRIYEPMLGNGLPAGVKIYGVGDASIGNGVLTPVPGFGELSCPGDLVNGIVDILVNINTNRGHWGEFGGFTLCLKSHFGTFPAKHGGTDNPAYIFALAKSAAIIGGEVPRQQLNIIDSLFSAISGPGGTPDHRLDRLVMATFAPAVDYLTHYKIRMTVGEVPLPDSNSGIPRVLAQFGPAFGYTDAQFKALNLVDVPPAGSTNAENNSRQGALPDANITLLVAGNRFRETSIGFYVPDSPANAHIAVFDMSGRAVHEMTAPVGRANGMVTWNGTSSTGNAVAEGVYFVKLRADGTARSGLIKLVRK